ncbi:uncharacterized protein EDB91DRAFT_1025949, partial [Suillus paluster]|uniref:uncharacterized protein n=1 Tax=Suillus paluster TaxID=48578 RepID=UPI001B87A66A
TKVEIIKAELEEKQFKVKLTVIDTPAFGDYVNNCDSPKSKSSRAELEEKQFKVKLTVIDTPAFGDYVDNCDSPKSKSSRLSLRKSNTPGFAIDLISMTKELHYKNYRQQQMEMRNARYLSLCTCSTSSRQRRSCTMRTTGSNRWRRGMLATYLYAHARPHLDDEGVALRELQAATDGDEEHSLPISMHMLDLISMTKELHYENYRQQQMETRKFGEP